MSKLLMTEPVNEKVVVDSVDSSAKTQQRCMTTPLARAAQPDNKKLSATFRRQLRRLNSLYDT